MSHTWTWDRVIRQRHTLVGMYIHPSLWHRNGTSTGQGNAKPTYESWKCEWQVQMHSRAISMGLEPITIRYDNPTHVNTCAEDGKYH